jgi:membrane-associated phospholipid phosphatase
MSEQAYASGVVRGRPARSERQAGVANALALALLCLLAAALTWVLAAHVPAFRARDTALLRDFTQLDRPWVTNAGDALLHLLDPVVFLLWGVALVFYSLGRGRPRVALAIGLVMALAPLTADTLKPLLAHRHVEVEGVLIGAASWPSGHSTAALTLALCAVLAAPRELRTTVAAVGGLFVLAVCCTLLILEWHMPSDVLGGLLVATLWMALAVAALRACEQRWPSRPPR